jgi:hypothetical protein
MGAVVIHDEVWTGLETVYRGSEPTLVLAALGEGPWRCPGCGRLDRDGDSAAVLVLHYGIRFRDRGSGNWCGATIDQPPDRGRWELTGWQLRRHHPGCVTAFVVEATADSPLRRPGDPLPEYPPARPESQRAGTDRFWLMTGLPCGGTGGGMPAVIWQPETPQPIVDVAGDVYPVRDVHVQKLGRIGVGGETRWWRRTLLEPGADAPLPALYGADCLARVGGDGAITVHEIAAGAGNGVSAGIVTRFLVTDPGWLAAVGEYGMFLLVGLAGGTLNPGTTPGRIWDQPALRAAVAGPIPHMLPDAPEFWNLIGSDDVRQLYAVGEPVRAADFARSVTGTTAQLLLVRVDG